LKRLSEVIVIVCTALSVTDAVPPVMRSCHLFRVQLILVPVIS